MKIKVSIIIPAYNVENYIERCLNSARTQTLKEIEIIVVNDGSTDGSTQIIEKISKIDNRVLVIYKENGGVSSARNAGLKVAQGEYIQYLDGDDWLEKDGCEVAYYFAMKYSLDIVVLDFLYDDDNGNVRIWKDIESNKIYNNKEYLKCIFQEKTAPSVFAKLIKKELHKDIFFPENYAFGEDLATLPKLAYSANKIGKLDRAFMHYILNPRSITNSDANKKAYEKILVCKDIKDYFINKQVYEVLKEDIDMLMLRKLPAFMGNDIIFNNKQYQEAFVIVLKLFKKQVSINKNSNIIDKTIFHILNTFPYAFVLVTCLQVRRILIFIKKKLIYR